MPSQHDELDTNTDVWKKALNGSSNTRTTIPTSYSAYAAQGISQSISYQTLAAAYKSWVYIAVNKIANTVASLPLQLYAYKRGEKWLSGKMIKGNICNMQTKQDRSLYLKAQGIERVAIDTHPFHDLLLKPNPIDTRFTLWYTTMMKLELSGSIGWYLPKNSLGQPAEILVLPLTQTAQLRPIPDPVKIVSGFIYQDGNLKQIFEMDEIAWIRYPSPRSPYEGMSALKAQTYPYDIDDFIAKYQYYMFKNNATPGFALSTDQKLRKAQVDDLISQITSQWGGVTKAGKPMVLHSGLKEAGRTGQNSKDLEMGGVSQEAQDKMLAAYGVSAGKVGLVKDVNRANMEALDKTFNSETLKPRLMIVEEIIERDILPMYDDRLTLDFVLPGNEDKELMVAERKINLDSGYHSINEERELRGEEPAEWGEFPWFTINRVQTNEGTTPSEGSTKAGGLWTPKYWTQQRKSIYSKAFEQRIDINSKPFLAMMRKVFKRQLKDILSQLETEGKRFKDQTAGWSLGKVKQHLSQKTYTINSIALDFDEEVKLLIDKMLPLYQAAVEQAGQHRMESLTQIKAAEFTFEFSVDDPAVDSWIETHALDSAEEITTTTINQVKSVLRDGLGEGSTLTQIAQTLREKFKGWDTGRANNIAWTETHAADNFGDLESVKQSGLSDKLKKTWIPSGDEHVRDTHAAAGVAYAEGIPIEQDFDVGSDSMQAPGLGTEAKENINCVLPGTMVSGRITGALKAPYSGKAVEIETRSGYRLSVTVNHPIMTDHGFISADRLNKGDYVVSQREDIDGCSSWRNKDSQQAVSRVEDIFDSLKSKGTSRVHTPCAFDLDGDGEFINGDINIVMVPTPLSADSNRFGKVLLSDTDEPALPQFIDNSSLMLSGHSLIRPGTLSTGDNCTGVCASSPSSPSSTAHSSDSSGVITQTFPLQEFRFGLCASLDISRYESPTYSCSGYSKFLRELVFAHPTLIEFDEIVDVHVFDFSGHVYDLQSSVGYFNTNNILSRNCRCTQGYVKA